jgi:hypothetical protein
MAIYNCNVKWGGRFCGFRGFEEPGGKVPGIFDEL